jgi:hypothetical protein
MTFDTFLLSATSGRHESQLLAPVTAVATTVSSIWYSVRTSVPAMDAFNFKLSKIKNNSKRVKLRVAAL